MPQVPTFESLPTVADARPDVVPQQPLDREQRQDLEAPGRAESDLGEGLTRDAASAAGYAAMLNLQQNEDTAKAAVTQHQGYVNNLLYKDSGTNPNGPDGGLYNLHGQAFVDAAPKVTAAIQNQRDQTVTDGVFGMPGVNGQPGTTRTLSGGAQRAYLAQTDQSIDAVNRQIMVSTINEGARASTLVSQARMQTAGQTAVLGYNDTNNLDAQAAVVRGEVADQARRDGGLPSDVLAAKTTDAVSSTILRPAIEKALSDTSATGPATLAMLWNQYQGQLSPTDNVILAERVKGPLLEYHASQRVQQLGGASPNGMDQPYQPGAGYYDAVHGGEGNGTNATTGASGPVQVIPATAAAFHASPGNANVDITTEAGARQFTAWYGDANAAKIQAVTGQPAKLGQVVAAHLLGPDGATAIIAHPNEPIGNYLSHDAIANNPGPLPGGPNMTGAEAQASISAYYSKASGNQFAGPGAPTGTAVTTTTGVTVPPPVRPNFEGMLQQEQASADDPALKALVMGKITANLHQYEIGQSTNRAAAEKQAGDTLTALENGATGTPVPTFAYAQTHSPAEVAAFNAKVADATALGNLRNGLQYATPTQVNAEIASAQAKLDGARPGPNGEAPTAPLSAEDMTTAAKHLAILQQVATDNAKRLAQDPWTYVSRNPAVAAAYGADMTDPSNVAKAVQTSMAFQRSLGVTNPQPISAPAVEQNVTKINTAKPDAVPALIDNLKAQYGSSAADVFAAMVRTGKLNPDYQAMASMTPGGAGRTDMAAAIQAKADKGDKFGASAEAATPGAKGLMENAINNDMADFQKSFPGSSGDGVIERYRGSVRTLATFYADRGMAPADAADAAYARVIGDQTDISGFVVAPKTLDGQPFSAEKVLDAGRGVTNGLKDADLSGGATAAIARARGQWVTNPDGQGVTLQVQNTDTGTWRIVKRADGSPVQMDYRRLPTPAAPSDALLSIQGELQ